MKSKDEVLGKKEYSSGKKLVVKEKKKNREGKYKFYDW